MSCINSLVSSLLIGMSVSELSLQYIPVHVTPIAKQIDLLLSSCQQRLPKLGVTFSNEFVWTITNLVKSLIRQVTDAETNERQVTAPLFTSVTGRRITASQFTSAVEGDKSLLSINLLHLKGRQVAASQFTSTERNRNDCTPIKLSYNESKSRFLHLII